jgi:DNA (cytosine-5)-methyltransferase 3A
MNVLSLFDGMSCGQIALDQLGVKVDNYYASEIDKYAIKVTQKNYPNTKQIGSVTEVKGKDLPKIDLIICGSPCQGFSFAGKQLNFNDPRSALFFQFVRLLRECKPKYFLLENVRMKKEYQEIISEHLGVEPVMINSALVSAQNRVRLYWTNIAGIEQPKDKGIVLKDILNVLIDSGRPCELKDFNKDSTCHHAATATDIKGNELIKRVYADTGKSPTLTTMGGGHREPKVLCGRIVGRKINPNTGKRDDYNPDLKAEQRLEPRLDEKSGTLTTVQKDNVVIDFDKPQRVGTIKGGGQGDRVYSINGKGISISAQSGGTAGNGNMLIVNEATMAHPTYRKLTPLECERLQTVPDGYTSGVSNTQRYKLLGNGFTVDVIKHILQEMIQ